ncbi:MAG: TIR domain-containing protein [Flectobacillus sp.]|nr:TIR domain-containing protein [Flectobacillus sp.]
MNKIDVFISRKSADASYAKKIYDYLTAQGLSVFESDQSLKELGNADYVKAIDEALVSTTHLIVVGSSASNINSSWVEAEWLFFLNRKRSGKTSGNLFTVITKDMNLNDVPPSLANYEIIPYNVKNLPIIYNYVRQANSPAKEAPQKPFPIEKQNKYLWSVIATLLVGILSAFIYFNAQPYDATVFLKPKPLLNMQYAYPLFKGGELSLLIGNKEETAQVLANGEVTFKQLAASSKGEKVAIKLSTDYWKLESDSVVLNKNLHLNLIPDGSLGIITGNVKTSEGDPISGVSISIDNDTSIIADDFGRFNCTLPYRFQKESYVLHFQKKGLKPVKEHYYPKSGNIDIQMGK